MRSTLTFLTGLLLVSTPLYAENNACVVAGLTASTIRQYPAVEADQGAAADSKYFYALDNYVIARYDRATGSPVGRWTGEAHKLLQHMNSCYHDQGKLYCANSNYSTIPMGSSIETFDARKLEHLNSHSLGLTEEGSLTWFDQVKTGWIAAFVHYGRNGGLPYKDSRYSNVVAFDKEWRRTGGWMFPASIVERMSPFGASGGALGQDGYLYITGHDHPEMYVLGKPVMGPYLLHIATIAIDAHGQAFSWADDGSRDIFAVNRSAGNNTVLQIRIPEVKPDCMEGTVLPFLQ